MQAPRPRRRALVVVASLAAAMLAIVVACVTPAPDRVGAPAATRGVDAVWLESEVATPVLPAPGSSFPRYPESLRVAGVTGEVVLQFVVNRDGRVDQSSIVTISRTHAAFEDAVRTSLATALFHPAKDSTGHTVRQLVKQPFTFDIAR